MTPQDQSVPYGYCQCGCGNKTPTVDRNRHSRNQKKGEPARFLRGHQLRIREGSSDTGRFKIDDVYCRLILLTQGQYAIVWECDYERISIHRWYAAWSSLTESFYAVRRGSKAESYRTIRMHREVLSLAFDDPRECDHAELWNTADNRRENLRPAGSGQNMQNRSKLRNNTTGLKWVTYRFGKYRGRIQADGISHDLGNFDTPSEAHAACWAKALELHGEFART